ncbi:MAG TPA: hydrogenase maturation protease [Mycobacterium sp.]|uniref:hydrogenase maturation protease n=1 Tax=Mycolicibacterium sp. TaxID=2320850 RepID=UPI0025FA34C5|nr:hydrogenase maturation protease [Mycolicibacterium sp.]HPX36184.1 hydrogenase maturation protease [Mycobacterium sp.]HQC77844.1 hydrogenase maturation protease [Mycobacterium sp.]
MSRVVVGVGNPYRRDDGIGPAVADAVADRNLPGVRVLSCAGEMTQILDAWAGAGIAVVIDAAAGGTPGRVRRCGLDEFVDATPFSSHELSLHKTFELARALDRAPAEVVVVTVDVADTGHGQGLSPPVAAALAEAVDVVLGILIEPGFVEQGQEPADQQP